MFAEDTCTIAVKAKSTSRTLKASQEYTRFLCQRMLILDDDRLSLFVIHRSQSGITVPALRHESTTNSAPQPSGILSKPLLT